MKKNKKKRKEGRLEVSDLFSALQPSNIDTDNDGEDEEDYEVDNQVDLYHKPPKNVNRKKRQERTFESSISTNESKEEEEEEDHPTSSRKLQRLGSDREIETHQLPPQVSPSSAPSNPFSLLISPIPSTLSLHEMLKICELFGDVLDIYFQPPTTTIEEEKGEEGDGQQAPITNKELLEGGEESRCELKDGGGREMSNDQQIKRKRREKKKNCVVTYSSYDQARRALQVFLLFIFQYRLCFFL